MAFSRDRNKQELAPNAWDSITLAAEKIKRFHMFEKRTETKIDKAMEPSKVYYDNLRKVLDGSWDDMQDLVNIQNALTYLQMDVQRVLMGLYVKVRDKC